MKRFQDNLLLTFFPNSRFLNRTDHSRLQSERINIAQIRTLLDFTGIEAANLSTSHMANDYFLSNPSFFMLDMLAVLYELRRDFFKDLAIQEVQLGTGKSAWLRLNCDELKQRSLMRQRIQQVNTSWQPYNNLHGSRPVISRCAKCHSEGINPLTPPIPFYDTLALAKRIRDPHERMGDKILRRIESSGSDRMSPRHPLSQSEIDSMKAFIGSLD